MDEGELLGQDEVEEDEQIADAEITEVSSNLREETSPEQELCVVNAETKSHDIADEQAEIVEPSVSSELSEEPNSVPEDEGAQVSEEKSESSEQNSEKNININNFADTAIETALIEPKAAPVNAVTQSEPPKSASSTPSKSTAVVSKKAVVKTTAVATTKLSVSKSSTESSTKQASAASKTSTNAPKSAPAIKEAVKSTSSNSGKVVIPTPKSSLQASKSGTIKSVDISATPSAGITAVKEEKTSIFEATEDSFDLQVDDTMLNELDADLLENNQAEEKSATGEPETEVYAEAAESTTLHIPTEEVNAVVAADGAPEESQVLTEEEAKDKPKMEEVSAVKDDKKAEEKKDEKEAKPVKRFVLF